MLVMSLNITNWRSNMMRLSILSHILVCVIHVKDLALSEEVTGGLVITLLLLSVNNGK